LAELLKDGFSAGSAFLLALVGIITLARNIMMKSDAKLAMVWTSIAFTEHFTPFKEE